MDNIYKKIVDTLESLGYTIREQGTYRSGETLPETFITFFVLDSLDISHADNKPTGITYRVQVTFYSKKPLLVQEADTIIKNLMIPADFMRVSGKPLPYNKETGHYAWTTDYRLYESEE